MTLPILNGGNGNNIADLTDTEYIHQVFIPGITDIEWRILAQMPPIKRITQLVLAVIAIRQVPRYPLPADHPLNPASRYEDADV